MADIMKRENEKALEMEIRKEAEMQKQKVRYQEDLEEQLEDQVLN